MIEGNHLVKTFVRQEKKGKKQSFRAVDDISIRAQEGQILGVLGPNGAGKTTLLRMLGFLMTPTEGEVRLQAGGTENGAADAQTWITDREECKRHISYLSENTKLYHCFSVREMLRLVGEVYGFTQDEIRRRTEEVAALMQMETYIDNRIDRLSTGQKQRVSIARCLLVDPEIYILDEPTLGLDVVSAENIVRFMRQEKEKGKTVLYSTHYMEEAEILCDRIVVLKEGKIIAEGTPEELIRAYHATHLRDAFFRIIGNEGEGEAA